MWSYNYTTEIYHHGILGQKWGDRNGPPYPLDSEDHSAKEKRDGYKKSLKGKNEELYDRNSSSKKKFQLTDQQKKYLKIGAGVAAGLLVAYGGYKLYQNKGIIKSYINLGKDNVDFIRKSGNFDWLSVEEGKDIVIPDNLKGTSGGDILKSLKGINPSNESNHCQQNVVASCLKFMGFKDITTKPGVWSTTSGSVVDKVFKGAFEAKVKTPNINFNTAKDASDWIIKRLKPIEGSCGSIQMHLKNKDYGHAIMWYMKNGDIHYADPFARTSSGFKIIEDASIYFGNYFDGTKPVISRLDNLEINFDVLKTLFNY